MANANACGLFRLKSVGLSKAGGRKPCSLLAAARHNLREEQEERGGRSHIDLSRTDLNVVIAGPADAHSVLVLARDRMDQAGVAVAKLRRDHVQAIELMFSLPTRTQLDDTLYFVACKDWSALRFGEANLLSAVIHRDESAPHCHVLVLPLKGGRMAGGELKRAPAMAELRASFFGEVAEVFGLSRGRERMTVAQRRATADAVLSRLNTDRDPCMRSAAWQAIRDSVEANPAPYATALGLDLDLPTQVGKRARTMVQIFTSTGRGPKHEVRRHN